jgi:hypothetical protein
MSTAPQYTNCTLLTLLLLLLLLVLLRQGSTTTRWPCHLKPCPNMLNAHCCCCCCCYCRCRDYLTEYNDTLATLLLAGTTQSLAGLAELGDRLGLAYERSGRRGRGGGGGMTAASLYGM